MPKPPRGRSTAYRTNLRVATYRLFSRGKAYPPLPLQRLAPRMMPRLTASFKGLGRTAALEIKAERAGEMALASDRRPDAAGADIAGVGQDDIEGPFGETFFSVRFIGISVEKMRERDRAASDRKRRSLAAGVDRRSGIGEPMHRRASPVFCDPQASGTMVSTRLPPSGGSAARSVAVHRRRAERVKRDVLRVTRLLKIERQRARSRDSRLR